MCWNDADGMANNINPDQTAPLGVVWSGSALFAQAYLSENLGTLRYLKNLLIWKTSYIWNQLVLQSYTKSAGDVLMDQVSI